MAPPQPARRTSRALLAAVALVIVAAIVMWFVTRPPKPAPVATPGGLVAGAGLLDGPDARVARAHRVPEEIGVEFGRGAQQLAAAQGAAGEGFELALERVLALARREARTGSGVAGQQEAADDRRRDGRECERSDEPGRGEEWEHTPFSACRGCFLNGGRERVHEAAHLIAR